MKLRSRLTGAALVGTLAVFGLAACGSDDEGDSNNDSSDSSSQSEESTEPSEDTSEGDGDKPSKDDVVAGYSGLITEILGGTELPQDILNSVVTCFVDEVYDDASAQTLQAIADGNAAGIDPADTQLFTDASTTCQSQIAGG
ncbi:hypothetical protein [Aeromicrobium sp. Leaf350]|uniref:hypothetical protein n=1 Tax=Aeromicrobium sp. Leaf350 TaxID=2876565 RepID=UPI001E5C62A1|nr:hypothetical protein [Aeromicrobium sp. Leaf350]